MNVPDGWEVKTIANISKTFAGGTPNRENNSYYGGSIPWVKSGEVNQSIINKTEEFITFEGLHNSSAKIVEKGTILVAMYGATAGQIAILNIEATTNQAILAIPLKNDEISFVLNMISFHMPELLFQAQGSGQPNLSKQLVDKMLILIPKEKKEQQKIAKILSTLDKTIESTQKLIDKEKNIKKGLMNDLLTNGIDQNGKIRTPQTHEYKESELGMIPDEWEIKKIENIADIFGGGTPDRSNNDFWENGAIFWATPTDMTAIYNSNYIEDTKEKITEKGLSGSSAKLLPLGSILLTSRATIGERKISKIPVCTNQGFTSLVPKGDNGMFIYYLLDKYISYMYSRAYGTTFSEISRTEVKNMSIALPETLDEQKQIAKILTIQDKKIETEEQNLTKLKELKKGLMSDLLSGKVRVKS